MDEMTRMDGNGSGAVDLNRASVEEIRTRLPGVGRQQAKRIVAHRQKHGFFRGFDDLLRVQGLERRIAERLSACRSTVEGDGPLAVDVASFSGETPPPGEVSESSAATESDDKRGPRGTLVMDPGILSDLADDGPRESPTSGEDSILPPSGLPLVQADSDPEADAVMARTVFASPSATLEEATDEEEDRTRVASLGTDSALDALDALESVEVPATSEASVEPSSTPPEESKPGRSFLSTADSASFDATWVQEASATESESSEPPPSSIVVEPSWVETVEEPSDEIGAAADTTEKAIAATATNDAEEDEPAEDFRSSQEELRAAAEEEREAAEEFEEATNDADALEDEEDQPVVEARAVSAPARETPKAPTAAQPTAAPVRLGPIALAALGIALGAGAMGALVARSGPPLAEREEVEAATRSVQEVKQETTAAAARITSVEAALDKSTERVRALAAKTEEQDAALQTTHSSFAKMQKELATSRTDAARAQRDLASRISNLENALGLTKGSGNKRNQH